MFKILPSKDPSTIVLEVEGEATGRDAKKLDEYVGEHFKKEESFNVIAHIQNLSGVTQQGFLKGIKVDAKRWKQIKKFAVVSEKDWITSPAKLADYLPGINVKVFEPKDQEDAWKWIKQ
ncbi:STAS/SEC14 domain-containing protein [Halobacillus andaensis]|uniref:STAS/SEC14 domain-containing protein n=1 Tax=Halobacillus andaensis TaxID=1176239 RepID=UPI003D7295FC